MCWKEPSKLKALALACCCAAGKSPAHSPLQPFHHDCFPCSLCRPQTRPAPYPARTIAAPLELSTTIFTEASWHCAIASVHGHKAACTSGHGALCMKVIPGLGRDWHTSVSRIGTSFVSKVNPTENEDKGRKRHHRCRRLRFHSCSCHYVSCKGQRASRTMNRHCPLLHLECQGG